MTKRKLSLLIACAALLVICVVQTIVKSNDKVKYFELKDEPDSISIVKGDSTITLEKFGENWLLADKSATKDYEVDQLIEAITSVKALDKVASKNEKTTEMYDFVDGKTITVSAVKKGKTVRTVEIGKEATTSSQCYITVDGKNEIYLAGGNLKNIFNKTEEDLKQPEPEPAPEESASPTVEL